MDKPAPLPTDVAELTTLVRTLQAQVTEQTQFIDQLLEQIRLARHQHFGTRSERFSIDQIPVPFEDHDDNTGIDDSDVPVSTPPAKLITQGQRQSRCHGRDRDSGAEGTG